MRTKLFTMVFIYFLSLFFIAQDGFSKGEKLSKGSGQSLDKFEDITVWIPEKGEGTTIETSLVKGKKGKAIEIEYDLADTKQWVGIRKNISMDVAKKGKIIFWVKGKDAKNNVELKLVDEDSSNFIHTIGGITANEKWTKVVIPINALIYGWGGDKKLDKIKEIWINITFGEGEEGKLIIDNLEYIK